MLLKGKNAIITGCRRGIGKAAVELFARNGANIWACCRESDTEFLTYLDNLSNETGVIIIPVYFDLTDKEQIKQGVKEIIGSKRKIDILVNIAGITYNALLNMTSSSKLEEVFNINVFAQIHLTQYIAKIMMRQNHGNIINVSSMVGLDGNYGQVAYSASKAAVAGMTKTMAMELADYNIRVNAVAPGVIDTDMIADIPNKSIERLLEKSCLKRLGTPAEVANLMIFLAADMSSYITGQIIRVDGGIN